MGDGMKRAARLPVAVLAAVFIFGAKGVEPPAQAAPAPGISSSRDIVANMQPFPVGAQGGVDALFALAAGTNLLFKPHAVTALVDFVRQACVKDSGWKMADLDGAEGSGYVVKIKIPLAEYLAINFHPEIPDYAVFPASVRYSEFIDDRQTLDAYSCIGTGPTGGQEYVVGRMDGMEEITPNPESGAYFSYTNSRTFLRCRVADRDVLFSCARTKSPSTFSCRGAPVGPAEQALFYYSGKPGLNMTGMTWMLSRIVRSTTLSVYVSLDSNETAVATFAWLDAGWKGMNVTRAKHILNSQKTTLDVSRRIAEHPDVTAGGLAAAVGDVRRMADEAINREYARYLAHVRSCRDSVRKGLFGGGGLLRDLYDEKVAEQMSMPHRRALVVQERVRTLLGIPSWSAASPLPSGKGP